MSSPAATPFRLREVERVDPPTPECFERQFRRRRHAVVLRGLLAPSEIARWSFDALGAEFGGVKLPTHATARGVVVANPRRGVCTEPRALAEVLADLEGATPSLYLMTRVDELPEPWRQRVPMPPYCAGAPWLSRKLWISPTGSVTMMHRDMADNIHVQLLGSKRFTLVDARQSRRLYPNSLASSMPNGCRLDIEAPDFGQFPLARDLEVERIDLQPGDALYIPRGTWHHVRTVNDSLSTNCWWAPPSRLPFVVASDLFKRLRGINR